MANCIKNTTTNPKEELEILLLWAEKYMNPDIQRFSNGGVTLETNESIKKQTGLCDEYCNILNEFCLKNGIPAIRIEGYVKEQGQGIQKYDQTNHAWNAVYIDSAWLLCDLFWSTCQLKTKNGNSAFNRSLDTTYFLNIPSSFIQTHLPADPLFQFSNAPIGINDFINNNTQSTLSGSPYNYVDSLSKFLHLNRREQLLQIAENSYLFNHENPNMLIVTYYNYAIDIYNNPNAKNAEMIKAIDFFNKAAVLVKISTIESIRDLANPINQASDNLNQRLAFNKKHKR